MDLYMEMCGAVKALKPLRSMDVVAHSRGEITYVDFTDLLDEFGLSTGQFYHVPGREHHHTYYIDFDRGIYHSIFFNIKELRETLAYIAGHSNKPDQNLLEGDWVAFYTRSVPVALRIWDFQRRFMQIGRDELFTVWLAVYKSVSYSFGTWRKDVLDKVFSVAPAFDAPEPGEDGFVTVFRGQGEKSQNAASALSWSIHPGIALYFAYHNGHGTQMAIGKVAPKHIVYYDKSFSKEEEVIVRPGSVRDIQYADMLPARFDVFIKLAANAMPLFLQYGSIAYELGYPDEREALQAFRKTYELLNLVMTPPGATKGFAGDIYLMEKAGLLTMAAGVAAGLFHGVNHILRVLMLSLIYFFASGEQLTTQDLFILIYFSLLHDIGRGQDDSADSEHGRRGVQKIQAEKLEIPGINMPSQDLAAVQLMIEYHCRPDKEGNIALGAATKPKDYPRYKRLFDICRDMDALDRVRFQDLDYRLLRLPFSRQLPMIAGTLLHDDYTQIFEKETRSTE